MSDEYSLDKILDNIRIMQEYNKKIKDKLATETNPKLKEQAFREYAPMDQVISIFSELINEEDFKSIYKEKENGSKQQEDDRGTEEDTGRTSG